jgi:hypothetical protein
MQRGIFGWNFPDEVNSDPHPLVGGHFRRTTPRYLRRQGFRGEVLVTGGLQRHDPSGKEASKAKVLARAIKRRTWRTKVTPIGTENRGHTLGNIADYKDHVEKRNNTKQSHNQNEKKRKVLVITSDWHMPRTLTLFLYDGYVKENGITLVPVFADDPRIGGRIHQRRVQRFYSNPLLEDRIDTEAQGVIDVFFGYKPHPK